MPIITTDFTDRVVNGLHYQDYTDQQIIDRIINKWGEENLSSSDILYVLKEIRLGNRLVPVYIAPIPKNVKDKRCVNALISRKVNMESVRTE